MGLGGDAGARVRTHHACARDGGVTLHYRTGWGCGAAVHLSRDGGASWAREPFLPGRVSPVGPRFRVAALPPPPLRFALTDGAGAWDNPAADCDARYRAHGSCGAADYRIDEPGVYVLFGGRLSRFGGDDEDGDGDGGGGCRAGDRALPTLRRDGLAVVTDIDGTLYGCPDGLARLNEIWCRQLALSGAFLVYNTGRSIESVVKLLREHRKVMPVPVAAITRVGGYVHWFRKDGSVGNRAKGEWLDFERDCPPTLDTDWHDELVNCPGWDDSCIPTCRDAVNDVFDTLGKGDGRWLEDGIHDDNCLQLAISVRASRVDEVMEMLHSKLVHLPVKFIMSGNGSHKYLDITVANGGKLGGTRYVANALPGPSGNLDNVVFCGDSGNDIDALRGDVKGIVVGNAQEDLMRSVQRRCMKESKPFRVVVTKAGFANGILEGLETHGFLS